ncbi:sarcosine oxidase subunit gamma family protein [uncultured Tateyamaria sp.]|uniref:sarcosine oxidase subunit gamma n=1 Tax=uncultured Tateyamaria sp. TaxID=455651 RepID=UPI002610AA5D|nr:sarcosine oxidase subunit gamma family protein [uncultured Tateyamaria sp.]
MSKTVTALNGARFADGIADVAELPMQGMITLRGDLGMAALKKAVKSNTSLVVPDQGQVAQNDAYTVAWMSPDEVLILCPYAEVQAIIAKLDKALIRAHALAVDVSDARAMFQVAGVHARAVMAKLAPVDVSERGFQPGMFRRTRLAQAAAAFWVADADTFHIICFRSQGQYMFDLLCVAAQKGSEVGRF